MHLGWRPCLIFRCKGAAKCTATLPAVALRPVHTVAWLCPTQIRRTSSTHSGLCFSNSDTCKVALVPIRAVSGAKAAVELESVTTVLEQGQSASPLSNGGHTNHTGIARKGASTHTPHMALHGPSDSSPDISEQAHRLESGAPESTGAAAVASSVRVEAETGVRRAAGAAGAAEPEYQPAVNDSDAAEAPEWLQRTTLLLGHGGVAALRDTRVVLVGLGGVGSYVAEFLVRAGVGSLAIVDGDVVDVTNKNRQLPALDSTIGLPKAHVMSRRLLDINPDLHLVARQEFLSPDTAGEQLLDDVVAELDRGARAKGGAAAGVVSGATCVCVSRGDGSRTSASGDGEADGAYCSVRDLGGSTSTSTSTSTSGGSGEAGDHGGSTDALKVDPLLWVVDCIDSVAPKLALVAAATRRGARVISSMGAGGRMDPLAVQIADISETYGDPFAATCRRGLRRKYGIRSGVTVVFSTEPCRRTSMMLTSAARFKRSYYGTISFIPALFGLQIAAHIVNEITGGPMMSSEAEQRQRLRQLRHAATGGKAVAATSDGGGSGGRARAQGSASSTTGLSRGRRGSTGSLAAGEDVLTAAPPPQLTRIPQQSRPDSNGNSEAAG